MLFKDFAKYLDAIESVSSRLAITEKLAALFTLLAPDEIAVIPYLLQGRVAPAFTGIEFGVAEKSVVKAAASALQMDPRDVQKYVLKTGDLGLAIESLRSEFSSLEEKDLTILECFAEFENITKKSGAGSQEAKSQILSTLISQADPMSCRYLARIPLGAMRLGASDITLLDALSWMISGGKSLRKEIEKAYQVRPDLGFVAKQVKLYGVDKIAEIKPVVGTPILMMRAERLSSGAEIIENLGSCYVEPKYDGFRLQIHVKNKFQIPNSKFQAKEVNIFTRGMENATHMYPDIVEAVKKEINAENFIIEGEALGFDEKTGNFLPFQETIQRKRKHDVEETAKRIPLRLMTFDVLYIDNESVIDKPLSDRKEILEKMISKEANCIHLSPLKLIHKPEEIEKLFDEYVTEGLEGIMAKKIDSVYKPGAREYSWVKLKRSYSSKVQDTIDCVVLGYDLGKGKRADFGIGAALLGVYDSENDKYLTVSKMGTGLTDDEWRTLRQKINEQRLKAKPEYYDVKKEMECDVWVGPSVVLEIRSDELTTSKLHTSGYGLRFPRLERFRDDKKPEDATSLSEIVKMANT
ncbi:MAG: ATP-dependent DNA ligase [Patescibacteria group bacterium]